MKQKFDLTAIIKDKRGRVLSIGKNSYIKTHPLMVKLARKLGNFDTKKIFIHAELDAIIKCSNIRQAYKMEIYRYLKDKNTYSRSKPCKICLSAIDKTPIKYIQYINNNLELVIEKIK